MSDIVIIQVRQFYGPSEKRSLARTPLGEVMRFATPGAVNAWICETEAATKALRHSEPPIPTSFPQAARASLPASDREEGE